MTCITKLSKNINKNCETPLIGGVRDNIYIINFEDWLDATFTKDPTNDQIYTGITLPSGAYAFRMEGINNSPAPNHASKKLKFGTAWVHKLKYILFDVSPDTELEVEALLKSMGVVAIVERNFKGANGNAAFKIYGADCGMKVPDGGIASDPNNADTQGAYEISVESEAPSLESHTPATLFNTDYSTTKAILLALVAA